QMENEPMTELSKTIVQEAVDQCDDIENSLEGCVEVLQNIRMPNSKDDDIEEREEDEAEDKEMQEETEDESEEEQQVELWKKPSYTVCIGKKYPELIEIDGIDEIKPSSNSYMKTMINFAKSKLQKILGTQRNIVRRLENVNDNL
ncbi:hypothetical protein KR215_002719, partial [Drosophila sulfurigaster]